MFITAFSDGENMVFFSERESTPAKLLIFIGAVIPRNVTMRRDFNLKSAFTRTHAGAYLNTAVEQGM